MGNKHGEPGRPETPLPSKRFPHLGAVLGLSVITAISAGGAFTTVKLNQAAQSGIEAVYQPKHDCRPLKGPLKIATFNVANELPERTAAIRKFVSAQRLSVLALQETSPGAVPALRTAFPCYSVSYVLAHAMGGGKGNALLVRGRVKDVKSFKITNKPPLEMLLKGIGNFIEHVPTANASTNLAENKIVEPRAAIAVTTTLPVAGIPTELRFVTGHIGRQKSVRAQQRDRLMGFLDDQAKQAPNTFFGGDLNTQPSKMLGHDGVFAEHGFYSNPTRPTYVHSQSSIDYWAASKRTQVYLTKVERDTSIDSDHYPVVAEIDQKGGVLPEAIQDKVIEWLK